MGTTRNSPGQCHCVIYPSNTDVRMSFTETDHQQQKQHGDTVSQAGFGPKGGERTRLTSRQTCGCDGEGLWAENTGTGTHPATYFILGLGLTLF